MAGADLGTLSEIMKEFYLGPIQNQFNDEVLVTKLLPMDSENLEGLEGVIPLHGKRSGGIGDRGELVQLPNAGAQGYKQAKYDLKYKYARVQVSGPAISKTKSDAGAFAQALKEELSRIKDDILIDLARQMYGDGTGKVATIATGGVAGQVITLTSAEALTKGFIYVGFIADVLDSDGVTINATALEVTDVDEDNSAITVVGTLGASAQTDSIVRSGNVAAGGEVYEPTGLKGLITTAAGATVGGLNSGGVGLKFWDNGREDVNAGISLSSLMKNWNKAHARGARAGEVVAITTPGITRGLFETSEFKGNVRFVNSQTFDGGFEEVTFNTGAGAVKLMADRHAPWGEVNILHKKHFRLFSPGDWDFLSRDGLTIRWVPDYDAFQAVLFRYMNLGTDRRNTSFNMSRVKVGSDADVGV
jgi:hypothetical protein